MTLQDKGRDQTSLTEQKIANSHWSFHRICETLHIAISQSPYEMLAKEINYDGACNWWHESRVEPKAKGVESQGTD